MAQKISVYVDPQTHHILKNEATLRGKSLSEFMSEAAISKINDSRREISSAGMGQVCNSCKDTRKLDNMDNQKGVTVWFTGLSGAGKTTVALKVEELLREAGYGVERLDGDIVREHLTRDLGFSKADRDENIRRNSFVAALLTRNGVITLCSFISPYIKAREEARQLSRDFIEVYVNAPLQTCRERDVKGLYAKAEAGEIPEFTGVSDPYEPPPDPELELRTDLESVDESAAKLIKYLKDNGYICDGHAELSLHTNAYADLHLHTTASDGTLTPRRVVEAAAEAGFSTIAITDHDTTAGLAEALTAGAALGIEVIPGIELSALDGELEVHILGYHIDPDNPALKQITAKISHARSNRAVGMVEKLNGLGVHITLKRVKELAGNEVIGRPHIARAMLERGYISDQKEAFTSEYIDRGGKAYVERYKLTVREAIRVIKEAGGIAVLAHPGYLSDRKKRLGTEDISRYKEWGLQGIEVYYSHHKDAQITEYHQIAERESLLITGGSDCHGGDNPLLGSVRLPQKYALLLR